MRIFPAVLLLAAGSAAMSSAQAESFGASVNGVCSLAGTCPPTTSQASGGGTGAFYSYLDTLADGDIYSISGHISTMNDTSDVGGDDSFTITYMGTTQGSAASQADTLTIAQYYSFNTSPTSVYGTSFDGFAQPSGGFSANIAAGSSTTASFTSNGTVVANFGPYASPNSFNGALTLWTVNNTGVWNVIDTTVNIFAAGSPVGSYIDYGTASAFQAAPVPLPASVLLMFSGLGALAALSFKRQAA